MRRLGIFIIFFGGLACGSDDAMPPTPAPTPPPQNPDQPLIPDSFALSIVGWQQVYVEQGATATLQVRFTNNNTGVENEVISFHFLGDSKDTVLNVHSARTNAGGLAETTIRAGQIIGRVRLEARATRGNPVEWAIDVSQKAPITPPVGVLTGGFTLTSRFDIQTEFEGTKIGEVLTLVNDISDDPNDPGKFVVDRVLERVTNQTVLAVADFLRPLLNVEVNKLLMSIAPEMIGDLKKLAYDLSSITRRFEVSSLLAAGPPQQADRLMRVDHTLKQISWELDGKRASYSFTQLGLAEPKADNIILSAIQPDPAGVVRHKIHEHTFDLKFGSFVLVALNELVIPNINPSAHNMGELVGAYIQCQKVGHTMNSTVQLGGEALWTAACDAAMKVLGAYFDSKIIEMNQDATSLKIQGQTRLVDNNNDAYYDLMAEGLWSGVFTLAESTAIIEPEHNTFFGVRSY